MKIDPTIFGMYDIRGIFGTQITPEIGKILGKATGTYFSSHQASTIAIGMDNRVSGPVLKENFISGLREAGTNVIDLGTITTPMLYFSGEILKVDGGVIITASHNPPEYNGLKVTLKKLAIYGNQYQIIREIAEGEKFSEGSGNYTEQNLWPKYLEALTKDIKIGRQPKIVLDCGNGTTSLFAEEFLKKLGCEVYPLFTESDGNFPNHPPYPQKVEFYGELIKEIKNKDADAGVAFDGDGDRLGVYDEKGNYIQSDVFTVPFIRELLRLHPGTKMVMNISTSLALIEEAKKLGGEVVLWKTGYPFIVSKMKELGSLFGAEISGHFFFADRYYGFDDGFYATARFLEILASSNKPASELFTDIPTYFATPEFRVPCPDEPGNNKFTIIQKIVNEMKTEYPEAEILDFDGIRFNFEDGWGLIRASNTQPMLTGRAEAKTEASLENFKTIIKDKLSKYKINLDWDNPITE